MKDIITRFYTLLQPVISALKTVHTAVSIDFKKRSKPIVFSTIGYIMYSAMYTHKYADFTVHFQNLLFRFMWLLIVEIIGLCLEKCVKWTEIKM